MKKLNELEKLMQTVNSNREIIAFAEGFEGKIFLDYLKYTGTLRRICCIATEEVLPPKNPANFIEHFLPIISLENLPHFRDTAFFVVATNENRVEFVTNLLKDFGCKNIVIFTKKELNQAQNVLKRLVKNGDVLSWKINYITNELENIKLCIDKQNEVSEVNTKAFSEYRNAFRGKKVAIFATGPTAKYYKPIPDAIHIGVNFAWRRSDINLDYLFNLHPLTSEHKIEEAFDKIDKKIFVAKIFSETTGRRHSESISFNSKVVRAFVKNGKVAEILYQDICHHPVVVFRSVAFFALQFALFTYPEKIYLVGCDTNLDGYWFNASEKELRGQNATLTHRIKVAFARFKMFAKEYYPETEIISINPVGLKGLFTDVFTDEYKTALSNQK